MRGSIRGLPDMPLGRQLQRLEFAWPTSVPRPVLLCFTFLSEVFSSIYCDQDWGLCSYFDFVLEQLHMLSNSQC